MVIFGLLGKLLDVGWLQSAPDVLLIPMLILYYISLFMGAVYGLVKQEASVYLLAIIGIGIWIMGFVLGAALTVTYATKLGINLIILAALLTLHIMQYAYTKKWDTRLTKMEHMTATQAKEG